MYSLLLSYSDSLNQEAKGGLFDFDATLPLMVLQFLLLMLILNIIFYKPISKVLDMRDEYIRNSLTTASAYLVQANELTEKYEQQLSIARKEAQKIIRSSQQEAQDIVSKDIKVAQQEAQQLVENASFQLNKQKEEAIKTLKNQVDILSQKIQSKLLAGI